MLRGLFATKPVGEIVAEADAPQRGLKRTLGPWQLTGLGIGAIIGAGIFSTVGTAAAGGADHAGAGPAIVLSFLLTALCCGFAALCYAEFASLVPVSGSAYTYAYAALGELIGWIIGWDLIIEYAIGNVAIAISWAGYFCELMRGFGLDVPAWLAVDYRTAAQAARAVAEVTARGLDPLAELGAAAVRSASAFEQAPRLLGDVPFVFNVPAFGIVALITVVLVRGIKESAWFNSAMVALKLVIVLFFVAMGFFYVKPEHWTPFAPNGFRGVAQAAAILFFAYIGFDAISTASEEAKNPARDMPRAILGSLVVCTIIYVLVGVVLTGLLPWGQLGTAEPLATAFASLDVPGGNWPAFVISLGAVFATTSVLLVFQLGQPRIFFSMARDGLLPPWAAKVHPRFGTPHVTTILTGVFVAVLSGLANLDEIVQLTNIGTLFAFVLVCAGVTILRLREPDRPRSFRVPGGAWLVPVSGVVSCVFLMVYLPPASWWRFVGWLLLGLAVYLAYGYPRSQVGRAAGRAPTLGAGEKLAALGFLSMAVACFVLPHALGLGELWAAFGDGASAEHARALWGAWMGALGALAASTGLLVARARG